MDMQQTELDITLTLAELLNSRDLVASPENLKQLVENDIVEHAIKHGVAALIYQHWLNSPHMPKVDLSVWANVDKQLNIIHRFLAPETNRVFSALKTNNIGFVVLKGYALSELIYDKPHTRPRTDIDIIIDPMSSSSLMEVFQHLGFSNPRGWQPKNIIDQFSFTKDIAKGIKLNFDVHLSITNDKALQHLISYVDLATIASLQESHCPQLIDKPHALIHAVIHLLHHRMCGDLVKLIWFYDIWLLCEKLSVGEHKDLISLITDKGLSALFVAVLANTNCYFPSLKIRQLVKLLSEVENNPTFDYLLEKPSLLFMMWHNFTMNKGAGAKLTYLRETVFPPKQELYIKYGTESRWPLAALYLRRITTGAFKWLNKR
jgi:hypothetical protein